MKIPTLRNILFPATLMAAASAVCQAAPLWDIDLESMTVNSAISTASYVIGEVNTKPQSAGAGSVLIQNGYTVGTETLPGHSVVLTKSTTGADTASAVRFTMIGNAADYSANTDYQVTFDLLMSESAWSTATSLNVRMINNNSSTSVGALTFRAGGGMLLRSSFGDDVELIDVWNWGNVMKMTLQVDADNQTFNVGINGIMIGQIDLDPTGNPNPNLGLNRFWFGANSDNSLFAGGIGISNIETSTMLTPLVPEPGTVGLVLAAAVIGICLRQARIRREA